VGISGAIPADVPVMALGLGSNLIVRDGGVPGVVVRLGKAFARVAKLDDLTLNCGGGASGILVSSTARDAGIAGLEFLRSIPGTVGGFVRMNGGAYGREVKDILVDCDVVTRDGQLATLPLSDLGYTYRHSDLAEGAIVVSARFRGARRGRGHSGRDGPHLRQPRGQPAPAQQDRRLDLQEPPGERAWELVDRAGCRGLTIGGAQVSEKHTNFLINTGNATSADIETLGDEVRRRVKRNPASSWNGKSSAWEEL
jgi:UDP-N-acetylmuramate dehydrogenase